MIGSVALMLESFGMKTESDALWNSMQQVFEDGLIIAPIYREVVKTLSALLSLEIKS